MHRSVVQFVIVSQKVQKSMGYQQRQFRAERPAGETGLAASLRQGDGDFAEMRLGRLQIAGGREGEHIGHAIDLAKATVEGANGPIGGEKQSDAGPGPVGRLQQPLQKAAAVRADAAAARILDDDLYCPHRRVRVGCS